MTNAIVRHCYRYPIKGFTAEPLTSLALVADQGIAGDRRYAVERVAGAFDASEPTPLPKTKFVMLMKDERLALLRAAYRSESEITVAGPGIEPLTANLEDAEGRAQLEALVADFLGDPELTPRVVDGGEHKFTDVSVTSDAMMRAISVINLASIRALGDALGETVDPLRFRANIYVDGLEPWAEFDWVGKRVNIGDVELEVVKRTRRCPATEVNPDSGARDVKMLAALREHFGHADMGVYAYVKTTGEVAMGQTFEAPA